MAFLLSSERPAMAASTLNPLRTFARWVADLRAANAKRVALSQLLEFDPHRLDDLGINRHDLFDALSHPDAVAGRKLSARRAESARAWRR